MANDLVSRNYQPPSLTSNKSTGVDLDDEDLVVPKLTLVQPTSKIDGQGMYHLSLNGKLFESVDCVFFQNIRGRIMFNPDMSKQEAICGSDDRVKPSARFEQPIASNCVDCKFSKKYFGEEIIIDGKKRIKECCKSMIIKGMFIDTLIPFIYTARKTALFPINSFLTEVLYESRISGKPLYCYVLSLKSKVAPKAINKYYIPVIERKGVIEKEEFERMVDKFTNMDVDKAFEADQVNKPEINDKGEGVPF